MRKRKIVQWGLAYLATAWVLVQAFGFLPAVVIAWYHGEKGGQQVTREEAALLGVLLAVGVGLAWWAARPSPGEPVELAIPASFSPTRIAVLPFEDFSPGRDQQFLGDGIADTLLRTFAGIEGLSVIARASAFAYRGRDIGTIARDLQVGSVLEGSVQRSGDRLRIVAQLVRTADQSQLWSLNFERPAGDIFAIQDEITAQVVEALLGSEVLGLPQRRLARTSTEAYDLYLKGRELWQQRERASIIQAVELLEQAVALDPEDAQAHGIRGLLLLNEGRLADSRVALDRALALRPNDVNLLGWRAMAYSEAGMMSSAARYTRRAYELDTMNLYARIGLIGLLLAENPPEAVALAREPMILDPVLNLPQRFETVGATLHNAARLTAAGVEIAFSTPMGHGHNSRNIPQGAGIAVAHGLPWQAGLCAITAAPARIYGLERVGQLQPGFEADVVIRDGDLLEVTSAPEAVFIKGRAVSMESRQTLLRDRYLEILGLPRD